MVTETRPRPDTDTETPTPPPTNGDTNPPKLAGNEKQPILTREQVMDQLANQVNLRSKDVDHTSHTRIVVTPDMVTLRPGGGQHSIEVAPEGGAALLKFAGIPEAMMKNLTPPTIERVATELLGRKERYTVLLRDSRVVDFVPRGTYRNVPPERVMDNIDRAIPEARFSRVLTLPRHIVSLDVIGDNRQPVARGDLVQAGANIVFSPIGTIAPMVKSYVLQLACTNGNVSNRVLREFHFGGEGDDLWQFFRKATKEAYHAIDGIVAGWRNLIEARIPEGQRAERLEALQKEAHITDQYAATVRAWAVERPPRNEYDLMNLITRASTHLLEEPRDILKSREVAAHFAEDPASHRRACPVCHRTR